MAERHATTVAAVGMPLRPTERVWPRVSAAPSRRATASDGPSATPLAHAAPPGCTAPEPARMTIFKGVAATVTVAASPAASPPAAVTAAHVTTTSCSALMEATVPRRTPWDAALVEKVTW